MIAILFAFYFSYSSRADISTLKVALSNRPDSMNPTQVVSEEGHIIAKYLYESLVTRDSDGSFKGGLAERWQFNSEHTELTIWLRPNRVFSNGEKVSASDVVKMIDSCLKRKINLSFQKIKKAGVHIIDPLTIRLSFRQRNPEILNDLASVQGSIYREIDGKMIGTGPFLPTQETKAKDRYDLHLERNPHFTGRPVRVKNIIFSTDPNHADLAFTQSSVLPLSIRFLTPQVDVLGFNLGSPNLMEQNIREALADLLTKEMVDNHFEKLNYTIGGLIPLGLPGHTDTNTAQRSVKNVQKILKGRSFKVYQYNRYSQALADRFCKVLNDVGAKCQMKIMNVHALLDAHKNNQIEIVFARLAPSYPSVTDLLSMFSSSSQINLFLGHSQDRELKNHVDRLFKTLDALPPDAAQDRRSLAAEMDQFLVSRRVVKPYAYGVYKKVYYRQGLKLPNIGIMGYLDLDLGNVVEAQP